MCKGNPLTPLCFTPDPSPSDVPSTSNPSPMVHLVSRSSRFGSSPLPTSPDITRHHATYRDVLQSLRYLAPPASPPLPTRLSRDIPRHPAAPASIGPVPSLGYPTTSRDPVASPAAPCEIHDTTMSSGPSHYPPTSLPSDPTSPVTRPALPHAFRIPLRPRSCSSPAVALLHFASCSFPPFAFLLISFYVLYLIRVTLYIRLRLQVDPYPFLFGSPARYALLFSLSLHNKLNPSDPLLVPHSAPRLARPQ